MGLVKDYLFNEQAEFHAPYPENETKTGTDMKLSEIVPSTGKYLKKEDADPAILVTVKAFSQEDVSAQGEPPELKGTVHFHEVEKPLVLNQTNAQLMAIATGLSGDSDETEFIGKKIVLFNDPTVSFGGKITGGIRIRAARNQPAPAPREPGSDDDFNDPLNF